MRIEREFLKTKLFLTECNATIFTIIQWWIHLKENGEKAKKFLLKVVGFYQSFSIFSTYKQILKTIFEIFLSSL